MNAMHPSRRSRLDAGLNPKHPILPTILGQVNNGLRTLDIYDLMSLDGGKRNKKMSKMVLFPDSEIIGEDYNLTSLITRRGAITGWLRDTDSGSQFRNRRRRSVIQFYAF